jgi:hypothetical protein
MKNGAMPEISGLVMLVSTAGIRELELRIGTIVVDVACTAILWSERHHELSGR